MVREGYKLSSLHRRSGRGNRSNRSLSRVTDAVLGGTGFSFLRNGAGDSRAIESGTSSRRLDRREARDRGVQERAKYKQSSDADFGLYALVKVFVCPSQPLHTRLNREEH